MELFKSFDTMLDGRSSYMRLSGVHSVLRPLLIPFTRLLKTGLTDRLVVLYPLNLAIIRSEKTRFVRRITRLKEIRQTSNIVSFQSYTGLDL